MLNSHIRSRSAKLLPILPHKIALFVQFQDTFDIVNSSSCLNFVAMQVRERERERECAIEKNSTASSA